jgi:predicted TIM-barrel fold metal-dependent hydrolase
LDTLARDGISGIRFSLAANPTTAAATTLDMIEPLSKRVNALGWHVQINMDADQIVAAEDLWTRLPSAIVFDHMGHIPSLNGRPARRHAIVVLVENPEILHGFAKSG